MLRKWSLLVVCSVVVAVLWFVTAGMIGLMADNDLPHPLLNKVYSVMTFPESHIPFLQSYDSRTASIPVSAWYRYDRIAIIFTCLLWGFSVVLFFRFVVRRFISKRIRRHENAAYPNA